MNAKVSKCIYCGMEAETRDHLPPKCILEKPYPQNLFTVPSCLRCNAGFSKDEEYFLILMAKTSISESLLARIGDGGSISRALERSPKLDDRFFSALESDDEGRILLRVETERVKRVVQKIAFGIYFKRYKRIPTGIFVRETKVFPYSINDERPAPYFMATFTERFRNKRWTEIQKGVFKYIVVRHPRSSNIVWCVMDFHSSHWGVVEMPHPTRLGNPNKVSGLQQSLFNRAPIEKISA